MVTFGFNSPDNDNPVINIGPESYVVEGSGGINKVQVIGGLRDGFAVFGLAPSGLMLFTDLDEADSNAIITKRYNTRNWTTLNLVAAFIYLSAVLIWFWINVINLNSKTRKIQVLMAMGVELVVIGFSTLVYYLNYFDTETYNLNRRVSFFKQADTQFETDVIVLVNLVLHSIGSLIGIIMIFFEYCAVETENKLYGRIVRRTVFEYTLFNSIFLVLTEGQRNTGFSVVILVTIMMWLYYIWTYWFIISERLIGLIVLSHNRKDALENGSPISKSKITWELIKRAYDTEVAADIRNMLSLISIYTAYMAYVVYYTTIFIMVPTSRFFFEGYGSYWGFYIFFEIIPMVVAWLGVSTQHDDQIKRWFGKDILPLSQLYIGKPKQGNKKTN